MFVSFCRCLFIGCLGVLHREIHFPSGGWSSCLTDTNLIIVPFPGSEAAAWVRSGEGKSDRDVRNAQRARPWTEPERWHTAAAGVFKVLFIIHNGANGFKSFTQPAPYPNLHNQALSPTLTWGSKDFFLSPSVSEQQLYSVCKNMQTRVVELIPRLEDEGFIEELLMVNDDLNNAFIRYERCVVALFARIQGTLLSYQHTFMQKMVGNLCSGSVLTNLKGL